MTEREMIIDAFHNCITEPKCRCCSWDCDTIKNRQVDIPIDLALAVDRILTAQEPRVLTLEELEDWDVPIYFEEIDTNEYYALIETVEFAAGTKGTFVFMYVMPGEHHRRAWDGAYYNILWRCWTFKPTDEQMEAVKWG